MMVFETLDWKIVAGALPVLIAFFNFIYYMHSVYFGQTRPHLFTWLIWGLVGTVAGLAQWSRGAESGAWITLFVSLLCYLRAGAAMTHGEKQITKSDWVCLGACLAAIVLWVIIKDPLLSVVIVTGIDIAGFYPTIRKTWLKPYEDNMLSYFIFGLQFFLGFLAIEHYSLVTVLYPCSVIFISWGFVVYMAWRRQVVGKAVQIA